MSYSTNTRYETDMSRKIDKRIVRSEEAILEAGIRVLLTNRSASMLEIADAAGIGRATLYRHFNSREALVKKLAFSCYENLSSALSPYANLTGKAAIEKIFDIAMPMADRFNFLIRLWSFIEDDEEVLEIERQTQRDMGYLFAQAKHNGEIDKSIPDVWLTAIFDNTLSAGWELIETDEADTDTATQLAKRSFFKGCGTS
ncbi:MAG: TetR/AcrR family transcriptional regulator [Pseudomonadota bacterium]